MRTRRAVHLLAKFLRHANRASLRIVNRTRRRIDFAEALGAIDYPITGLTPIAREELGSLFALLTFAPLRIGLAGIRAPWADVTLADAGRFLASLRGSRWTQKRAAYDALHLLTFAAWYANPRSCPAIGYPGPLPTGKPFLAT